MCDHIPKLIELSYRGRQLIRLPWKGGHDVLVARREFLVPAEVEVLHGPGLCATGTGLVVLLLLSIAELGHHTVVAELPIDAIGQLHLQLADEDVQVAADRMAIKSETTVNSVIPSAPARNTR